VIAISHDMRSGGVVFRRVMVMREGRSSWTGRRSGVRGRRRGASCGPASGAATPPVAGARLGLGSRHRTLLSVAALAAGGAPASTARSWQFGGSRSRAAGGSRRRQWPAVAARQWRWPGSGGVVGQLRIVAPAVAPQWPRQWPGQWWRSWAVGGSWPGSGRRQWPRQWPGSGGVVGLWRIAISRSPSKSAPIGFCARWGDMR